MSNPTNTRNTTQERTTEPREDRDKNQQRASFEDRRGSRRGPQGNDSNNSDLHFRDRGNEEPRRLTRGRYRQEYGMSGNQAYGAWPDERAFGNERGQDDRNAGRGNYYDQHRSGSYAGRDRGYGARGYNDHNYGQGSRGHERDNSTYGSRGYSDGERGQGSYGRGYRNDQDTGYGEGSGARQYGRTRQQEDGRNDYNEQYRGGRDQYRDWSDDDRNDDRYQARYGSRNEYQGGLRDQGYGRDRDNYDTYGEERNWSDRPVNQQRMGAYGFEREPFPTGRQGDTGRRPWESADRSYRNERDDDRRNPDYTDHDNDRERFF